MIPQQALEELNFFYPMAAKLISAAFILLILEQEKNESDTGRK